MYSVFNQKGDSARCWWVGHDLRVLSDDKSVWCDRCNRRMLLVKKGYGKMGIDWVRQDEARLLMGIPKMIGLVGMLVGLVYLLVIAV